MVKNNRIVHIDALRGVAVLLMVMVHAAATWNPFDAAAGPSLLALIVSGLGGLAAPLFVTLFGWGMHHRTLTWAQRWGFAGFFIICQLIVNASAPHLFELFTPGVLSLFALLTLTQPWWAAPWHSKQPAFHQWAWFTGALLLLYVLLTPFRGPSQWDARVEAGSVAVVLSHLVLTGTYPLVPWVAFAAMGTMIAASEAPEVSRQNTLRLTLVGFLISIVILFESLRTGAVWALPTGDATLTFFPANIPFLIAATTGVGLCWLLAEERWRWSLLADLGRCSLTVYVAHFLPLVWLASLDEQHQWSLSTSSTVTLAYTLTWGWIGAMWYRKASGWTLEAALRHLLRSAQKTNSGAEVEG